MTSYTPERKEYFAKRYLEQKERILPMNRLYAATSGRGCKGATQLSFKRMNERCRNPNHDAWKYYGGRGIKVCDRWHGRGGYKRFVADMGERPTAGHQLHRLDNDGDYEPGNCVWSLNHKERK